MNDGVKTLVSVVLALALVGLVYATRPSTLSSERFSDVGEEFFPEFTNPLDAGMLEVIAIDDESATIVPFRVELTERRWIIPSHHGYPADAEENMAQAASSLIGLRKEVVVSDIPSDHVKTGVLDPDDPQAMIEGGGTRVTLSSPEKGELASLIIGDEATDLNVSGGPKKYYVREPGKNRVYATSFDTTFSTDFGDWVETDLLQLTGATVQQVIVEDYEVDEAAGARVQTERITLSRSTPLDSQQQWMFESTAGPLLEGEAVDDAKINQIISALRRLTIVGVRPKPERLAQFFAGEVETVTQADVLDLRSRGFFVTQDGNFASNEGELRFAIEGGVFYTLYFGEVVFGSGRALSAGLPQNESDESPDESPAADSASERRYVFVRIGFNPALIPEPEAPQPGEDGEVPEAAQRAYEEAVNDRAAQLEAAREQSQRLAKRFADWYYVIDAASFTQFTPNRVDLIKAAPEAPEAGPPLITPPGE